MNIRMYPTIYQSLYVSKSQNDLPVVRWFDDLIDIGSLNVGHTKKHLMIYDFRLYGDGLDFHVGEAIYFKGCMALYSQ